MKVIDLYNEIASGTPVKKVKYKSYVFEYTNSVHDYYYFDNYKGIGRWLFDEAKDLNDEVEIIEDTPKDKKIKRIQSCGDNLYSEYIGEWLVHKENYSEYDELLMNKINEIIDKINGGN